MLAILSQLNPYHVAKSAQEDAKRLTTVRESIGLEQSPDTIVISNPSWRGCCVKKWKSLTEELFFNVMVGRNGCLFTIDLLNFSLEILDCDIALELKGSDNEITRVYYKDCWTRQDIQYITHSNFIHRSTVRMIPDCDPLKALEMCPVHIYNLWKLHDSSGNFIKFPAGMEFVGCFSEGDYAVWLNYSTQKADLVLNKLQLLASDLGVSVDMLGVSARCLESGDDIQERIIHNSLNKNEEVMRGGEQEAFEMEESEITKENYAFPDTSMDCWIEVSKRIETSVGEEEKENMSENLFSLDCGAASEISHWKGMTRASIKEMKSKTNLAHVPTGELNTVEAVSAKALMPFRIPLGEMKTPTTANHHVLVTPFHPNVPVTQLRGNLYR